MTTPDAETDEAPLLQVAGLSKNYKTGAGQTVQALRDVSFSLARGEVLGVVGESGCGKSTLGQTLLRRIEPTAGRILFNGSDVTAFSRRELRDWRRHAQIVFQDPFGSLNPKHTVAMLLGEPLAVFAMGSRQQRADRIAELLELVGLPSQSASRYPHEFSGGQRQRIAIARALATNPCFLVCDEAVSALDVSIQSQIINLLLRLREQLNLTLLFISHDLSVIRHLSDRVAVMYLGKIVETAPSEAVMTNAQHPYTRALLSSIPQTLESAPARIVLQGELPDPVDLPTGCVFHPRCPERNGRIDTLCTGTEPALNTISPMGKVACHLHHGEL